MFRNIIGSSGNIISHSRQPCVCSKHHTNDTVCLADLCRTSALTGILYINFARIRDLLLNRSAKYGANMAVMILIFLCVLALIGVISTRYKKRLDLTATNRYTLSSQTIKILRSLKKGY